MDEIYHEAYDNLNHMMEVINAIKFVLPEKTPEDKVASSVVRDLYWKLYHAQDDLRYLVTPKEAQLQKEPNGSNVVVNGDDFVGYLVNLPDPEEDLEENQGRLNRLLKRVRKILFWRG